MTPSCSPPPPSDASCLHLPTSHPVASPMPQDPSTDIHSKRLAFPSSVYSHSRLVLAAVPPDAAASSLPWPFALGQAQSMGPPPLLSAPSSTTASGRSGARVPEYAIGLPSPRTPLEERAMSAEHRPSASSITGSGSTPQSNVMSLPSLAAIQPPSHTSHGYHLPPYPYPVGASTFPPPRSFAPYPLPMAMNAQYPPPPPPMYYETMVGAPHSYYSSYPMYYQPPPPPLATGPRLEPSQQILGSPKPSVSSPISPLAPTIPVIVPNDPLPLPPSIPRPRPALVPVRDPTTGRTSTLPRRFACTHEGCPKRFTTSGHLSRHVKTHLKLRPFSCPYPGCSSRFSRLDNMQMHFKAHSGGIMIGTRQNAVPEAATPSHGDLASDYTEAAKDDDVDVELESVASLSDTEQTGFDSASSVNSYGGNKAAGASGSSSPELTKHAALNGLLSVAMELLK